MNMFKKLQKNLDYKLLTIKYIGTKGEGVSNLTTEINYKETNFKFFVPFTLPGETVIVKPTLSTSVGVRADLVEINHHHRKELNLNANIFFNVVDVYFSIGILKIIRYGKLIKFLFQY